jgi:hypothetical protein
MMRHYAGLWLVVVAAGALGGCSFFGPGVPDEPEPRTERQAEAEVTAAREERRSPLRRLRESLTRETRGSSGVSSNAGPAALERPPLPAAPSAPSNAAGERAFRAAERASAKRILVSLEDKHLWLLDGKDTLFVAPIAIGTGAEFVYRDRRWVWETPQGIRRIHGLQKDPHWIPPNWHYYEIAVEKKLEPVYLRAGQRYDLKDGTRLEVRGSEVGRVNQFGNWWPFTPGTEIIFDGKVFVPPIGSPQRQIPFTLGTRRIDIGDGYLIHGTDQPTSIGNAASHGCIRMYNEDVEKLYDMVRVGMPVYIY